MFAETGNAAAPHRLQASMANVSIQGGSEGSIEFDESGAVGAVESRLSVVRTLVEDIAHNGGGPFQQEITVDGGIWRVTVERLAR